MSFLRGFSRMTTSDIIPIVKNVLNDSRYKMTNKHAPKLISGNTGNKPPVRGRSESCQKKKVSNLDHTVVDQEDFNFQENASRHRQNGPPR